MRADDGRRLISADEALHNRLHDSGKGTLNQRTARRPARHLVEYIIQIRDKGQHDKIDLLHQPMEPGRIARHEIHRGEHGFRQLPLHLLGHGLGCLDMA